MALFSWFSKKSSDEDYEQVLASLALSIQKRQTHLSEIRLRERRATLLVTTWAFAAWAAYVALWWTGLVGGGRARSGILWGVPVVLGPLVILFTRRIVQLWYARKGNAEEKTLKQLLIKQRSKIEEIKKKTNYYSTKNLLERYDDGAVRGNKSAGDASTPQKRGVPESIPSQLQHRGRQNGFSKTPQAPLPQTPVRDGPQSQPFSPALPPMPAPRKQWYDKLADAILGDDAASTGPSPASRYALICERCFSHNGLVKEEQWEDAQYLCPKCGHFNRSARARKVGMTSPTTPQSALSPSGMSLPYSAVSQGFPSTSAGLSTSQIPSPGIPSSAPSHGRESPSVSVSPVHARELSPKSPLSESTVLVEKHHGDQDLSPAGYDVKVGAKGEGEDDKSVQMEVDS